MVNQNVLVGLTIASVVIAVATWVLYNGLQNKLDSCYYDAGVSSDAAKAKLDECSGSLAYSEGEYTKCADDLSDLTGDHATIQASLTECSTKLGNSEAEYTACANKLSDLSSKFASVYPKQTIAGYDQKGVGMLNGVAGQRGHENVSGTDGARVIVSHLNKTVQQCADICSNNDGCMSFNHYPASNTCKLLNSTVPTVTGIQSSWWIKNPPTPATEAYRYLRNVFRK